MEGNFTSGPFSRISASFVRDKQQNPENKWEVTILDRERKPIDWKTWKDPIYDEVSSVFPILERMALKTKTVVMEEKTKSSHKPSLEEVKE